jgi:RNA polymerase sigma-70 factor (ECF subfamily)
LQSTAGSSAAGALENESFLCGCFRPCWTHFLQTNHEIGVEEQIIMQSVGNEQEFMLVYDEYFNKIYNFVLRSVLHRETAEDLTGTIIINALSYIKTKKTVINNFSAWIYKIATNELISYHNKKRGKKILSINDDLLNLEELVADPKSPDAQALTDFFTVKQAMEKLSAAEAVIIDMHFFEGKSYEEMASILNQKEPTIRSKVHRILKKLQHFCGYEKNEKR